MVPAQPLWGLSMLQPWTDPMHTIRAAVGSNQAQPRAGWGTGGCCPWLCSELSFSEGYPMLHTQGSQGMGCADLLHPGTVVPQVSPLGQAAPCPGSLILSLMRTQCQEPRCDPILQPQHGRNLSPQNDCFK